MYRIVVASPRTGARVWENCTSPDSQHLHNYIRYSDRALQFISGEGKNVVVLLGQSEHLIIEEQ